MRRSDIKATLNIAVIAATILLLGVTMAFGQTTTTTTLTASLSTIFAGQSDTLTALVNPIGGVVPTGTVTFYSNGSPLGTPVTLTNGSATLVTSSLSVGSDSLTAVYSGDSAYGGDTSNAVSV